MKLTELYPTEEELEKYLFEMANLSSLTTGVDRVFIWASQAQDGAKRHGPRVKVSAHLTNKTNSDDLFVLSIQNDPVILAGESFLPTDAFEDACEWVSKNKVVLLEYWRGEIATDEFIQKLVKVGST